MNVYEILNAVWKSERSNDDLMAIDLDFYERVKAYIHHLDTQKESETDKLISKIFEVRLKRVHFIFNDLISMRMEKLFYQVLKSNNSSFELPIEEKEFMKKLQLTMEELRNSLLGIESTNFEDVELENNQYRWVIFKENEQNIFVGTDLQSYGPFSANEIALLPEENVQNLKKRSKIDTIDIDK